VRGTWDSHIAPCPGRDPGSEHVHEGKERDLGRGEGPRDAQHRCDTEGADLPRTLGVCRLPLRRATDRPRREPTRSDGGRGVPCVLACVITAFVLCSETSNLTAMLRQDPLPMLGLDLERRLRGCG
jgi:hypothetical protein